MGLFPHALLLGALVLMTAGAPEIASAQTAFPTRVGHARGPGSSWRPYGYGCASRR